jgi:putative transposase
MNEPAPLAALSEREREQAWQRFQLLQPFLEGQTTLSQLAREQGIPLRTAQSWVNRYRQYGLAGLVRQPRQDRNQRRLQPELKQLIEGLALQKSKPTAAAIHRQIAAVAREQGWEIPGYDCVYDIVRSLDPGMVKLAQEGSKAYRQSYDLLYRRQSNRPNEMWQADHCLLDIWLLQAEAAPARPWLTAIEDDYSRCIAGYFFSFKPPNTQRTALTLRQAIWRKPDPHWHICGIPEIFYTDNGSDFISNHMEQVAADLKMRLVFSEPGMPRGRGRIERFFESVNQLFLCHLPGYGPEGKPVTAPALTLPDLESQFRTFLLQEYHLRSQKELQSSPQQRWEADGFLPHLPHSLEQLDLLLLTSATTRRVQRDGIHFQNLRYMDTTLAAYIGEEIIVRYDPRDMAEIRVYCHDSFLCRAVSQELAGQVVSLQDIIRARNRRRQELRKAITDRTALIETYLTVHQPPPAAPPSPPEPQRQSPKLKRYYNE